MKKSSRIFSAIAAYSLAAVAITCTAWCTTGMNVLGFITMAFAVAFTVCTYLAANPDASRYAFLQNAINELCKKQSITRASPGIPGA